MVNFSERALHCIEQAMASRTPTPQGLRLGLMGNPCSGLTYVIRLEQQPATDDQVVECQGLKLFIDIDSSTKLQDVEVDYVERNGQRGFTFDNPAMASQCSGCNKPNAS